MMTDHAESKMARSVAPEPLAREAVPLEVKLAAVKAYISVAGSCQPAAMHSALQAALAHYLASASEATVIPDYDAQALNGAAEYFEGLATGAEPAPLAFAQSIRRVLLLFAPSQTGGAS